MTVTHTTPDLAELSDQLPENALITDPVKMDAYRWDRANDPDAGVPLAVVRVETTEQVQTVVKFAARHDIPIVPRGAGSGLSGGSSAIEGGIVISLDRMRTIEIDPVTRTAVVEPGAFNAEVKAAAAAHGLWYPPDPSSLEFCSIGGNVATNAGGLCCVKYGVTTDYVLGITVVLADGTAVELGGARLKDVAGLSLTKLFIGSEGTLGIITRIVLRLIPAQRVPSTLVASFRSLDDATQAVLDISRTMRPSMLEFMDKTSINAVEDMTRMGLDREAEGMLIIQSDEPEAYAVAEIAAITAICEDNHSTEVFSTADPEEGEAFVVARRMAIPAVEQKGSLLLEDVGVPLPQLGALVRGMEAIAAAREVTIAVIAHAGDGNTHPLIVFDPMDSAEAARAQIAYGEVMDLAIALGGTITGEHGVGRLKKGWLGDYLGPEVLALNHVVKNALDPHGILNPGAIYDLSTEPVPTTSRMARAAALLRDAWNSAITLSEIPTEIRPAGRSDAYAVQTLVAELEGQRTVGWKIAATSRAGQEHINVSGPLAGRVLSDRVFRDRSTVSLAGNVMRVAELEFVFAMDRTLAPRPEKYSVDEVMAAVGDLRLGIEMPSTRFSEVTVVGEDQIIADGACAKNFVLGPTAPSTWREVDLVTAKVLGTIDGPAGHRTAEGVGANVLGDPAVALTWLVNELSAQQITLEAGQFVTTGTCCTPIPIEPGDTLVADYGRLGTISCSYTD